MTRRILHVWFPHWRTDLWQRQQEGGKPTAPTGIALYAYENHRHIVMAVDARARQRGVTQGMTIAQARHLAPGLTIAKAFPEHDASALQAMAQHLTWVAPWSAPDFPDGVLIDTTGSAHLHGGEAKLVQTIQAQLKNRGHKTVRLALSDTAGASQALTHFSSESWQVIPPGGQMSALDPLPVAALRLSSTILDGLYQLGITRISALRHMPSAPLERRFGRQIADSLHAASGLRSTPLQPLAADIPLVIRRSLREPVLTAEAIGIGIEALLRETCLLLQKEGLGARRLSLLCERVDRGIQSICIVTAEPIHDPAYLSTLFKGRIHEIAPGFGIEAMQIDVIESAPIRHTQHGLLTATPEREIAQNQRFLDQLRNRPGVKSIFQLVPAPSAVPERAQTRETSLKPVQQAGRTFPVFAQRPIRLLHPAEPICVVTAQAECAETPACEMPQSFKWRGHTHQIRHAKGPERMHAEWWLTQEEYGAMRDYWHVEDTQARGFWLYRRGDGVHGWAGDQSWFLQGFF